MTNTALETARRHIEMVVDHLKLDADGAAALRTAHEIALRTDIDGGVTYTDQTGAPLPGADVAGWLRSVEASRPHLLGKATTAAPSPASPQLLSTALSKLRPAPTSAVAVNRGSFSDLQARAASGDATALRQVHADMRRQFGLPDPSTPNLSQLMAAAKRGDTAALATLKENLKK